MAAKSYEERIADLQKKQSQLKARENALKKKQAADEAKKRSHRLIELGAIIESVLGRSTTEEDKPKLFNETDINPPAELGRLPERGAINGV